MIRVPFEERNLDAVKAGRFQFGKERKQLGSDMRGPEQQVHAGFHEIDLIGGFRMRLLSMRPTRMARTNQGKRSLTLQVNPGSTSSPVASALSCRTRPSSGVR